MCVTDRTSIVSVSYVQNRMPQWGWQRTVKGCHPALAVDGPELEFQPGPGSPYLAGAMIFKKCEFFRKNLKLLIFQK